MSYFVYGYGEVNDMFLRIVVLILFIICCKSNIASSEVFSNDNDSASKSIKSDNLIVDINGNFLSVKARDVSIKTILEEIVKISGIRGWVFSGAQRKITIELNDVSLQEGLSKILKNNSYAFVYNRNENDIGMLRTIVVKKLSKSQLRSTGDNVSPFARAAKRESKRKNEKRKRKRKGKAKLPNFVKESKSKKSKELSSKQKMKDFIENVSPNKLSSALSEALDTSIQNKTQVDFKEALESLKDTKDIKEGTTTSGGPTF